MNWEEEALRLYGFKLSAQHNVDAVADAMAEIHSALEDRCDLRIKVERLGRTGSRPANAQTWAIQVARDIVQREGTELATSARSLDMAAIEADSTLLATAIAAALLRAHEAGLSGLTPSGSA